jgi:hypothetical protein
VPIEEICIDLNVLSPLLRDCRLFEDGSNRASRLTRTTVDTLVRVDIELIRRLKFFLVLSGMNAVNRADIHAGCILYSNARLSDYVCHGLNILLPTHHVGTIEKYMVAKLFFSFTCSIEV